MTKPTSARELSSKGFWQKGPEFFRTPFEDWPIKTNFKMERLEGDLLPKEPVSHVFFTVPKEDCLYKLLYRVDSSDKLSRVSAIEKLHRVLAIILRWKSINKLRNTKQQSLSAMEVVMAKTTWIKWTQEERVPNLKDSANKNQDGVGDPIADRSRRKKSKNGIYRLLAPWQDGQGVWRVGGRSRETVPFTQDGQPAILLPQGHRYTYLAMLAAHNVAHPGVQQTVVQFRQE